ncbi:MAG: GNAT family N-acetyltransferase [Candidatus Bathyarchaeia archaeon]
MEAKESSIKEIKIVKYNEKHRMAWDDFIKNSKNGVFLFYRDYMEYHADRFTDFSLMFFDNNRLIAVMPANVKDDILFSHGGLTFGGIVTDRKMKTPLMLEIFDALKEYLKAEGIKKIIYKAIPHIYHIHPAEEDLYALFRHNARLIRRDVSSTIFMKERLSFDKKRRWGVKKSKSAELELKRSYDFKTFMAIEEENLKKKYGVKPTHTADEIQLLANKFPENIKLFASYNNGEMVAGTIIYESNKKVAHTQYISASDEGKRLYALDGIFDYLINEYYGNKVDYFDFGISTEKEGRFLNVGLITQKEEFGARAVVYDTYEIEVQP